MVCHEFKLKPSVALDMPFDEYYFLLLGLEWWKIREKEAIEDARH